MRMTEMSRDQELVQSRWPEWELMEPIGSGEFGVVYKARKHGFAGDSFAAIKVITISSGEAENGFSREQTDAYLSSIAHNYAREIKMMETVKGYSNIVHDDSIVKTSS